MPGRGNPEDSGGKPSSRQQLMLPDHEHICLLFNCLAAHGKLL